MANETYKDAYQQAMAANITYTRNQSRWQFLLDSFNGGLDYRRGGYLQRYQLETDRDFNQRLENTPLDNQCKSLISLYTSFLFRHEPQRELGTLENNLTVNNILEDADLDGRSFTAFFKDVATWSGVFGMTWICVAKPDVGAVTLADEQALGARPYLSLIPPLSVTDWTWARQPNGSYQLDYIKYIEEVNGNTTVIKAWTPELITTYTVDTDKSEVNSTEVEPNGLGYLPFVCAYAERSQVRGLGISLIDDVADMQKAIYNELSEVWESTRLSTHPSLVATASTNAQGASAGQIITMEENLDPALKPYVLEFDTGQIGTIYDSINNRKKMIDNMGNVGSVRVNETRQMSGRAMEVEMTLLNARLCGLADSMELAEEQVWQLIASYLGESWAGEIKYADDYSIRNVENELTQLTSAMSAVQDPAKRSLLEAKIMEVLGIETPAQDQTSADEEEIVYVYPDGQPISPDLPEAYDMATGTEKCSNCGYYDQGLCTRWNNAPVRGAYWCAVWKPSAE